MGVPPMHQRKNCVKGTLGRDAGERPRHEKSRASLPAESHYSVALNFQEQLKMDNPLDFTTKGKVISAGGGTVVFQPRGASYEFNLKGEYTGALNTPVECVIRGKARKVHTVPSGGNFTAPIQGPPR